MLRKLFCLLGFHEYRIVDHIMGDYKTWGVKLCYKCRKIKLFD